MAMTAGELAANKILMRVLTEWVIAVGRAIKAPEDHDLEVEVALKLSEDLVETFDGSPLSGGDE